MGPEGLSPLFPVPVIESQVHDLLRRLVEAEPVRVVISVDPISELPRNYGFVDFGTDAEAKALWKAGGNLKKCVIGSRRIRVVYEGPRRELISKNTPKDDEEEEVLDD